jgi:hypothetical protein
MARTSRYLLSPSCCSPLQRLLPLGAIAAVIGLLLGACFGGGGGREIDLEAFLVRLEDLPAGWEVGEELIQLRPPQGALNSVAASYRRAEGEGEVSVTAVLAVSGREAEVLEQVVRVWLAPGLVASPTDQPIPGSRAIEGDNVQGLAFREDPVVATVIVFGADDIDVEEVVTLMRERILRELTAAGR